MGAGGSDLGLSLYLEAVSATECEGGRFVDLTAGGGDLTAVGKDLTGSGGDLTAAD